MANRKQQRARAERLHIRTEINRRLHRAASVTFIMQSTHYTDLTMVSLPGITPPSSATWRMTWQNCRTLSTSNTTTKQHPEAIPHPCAGGFRTSVTGGSHEER